MARTADKEGMAEAIGKLVSAGELSLEMTNAGWDALKAVFARFGVDVMKLPFDHSAGFLNSDAPAEIYCAMRAALKAEKE